jgi:hypothetical protein
MTDITTLDFSNNSDGMVSLQDKPTPKGPPAPGVPADSQSNYNNQRENLSENNIDKEQMMELSTPLNEVMEIQPEPPMMQQQPMMPQQQPSFQQQFAPPMMDSSMGGGAAPQEQQAQPQAAKAANPGNLTDEQMDAIVVGLVAAVAFSPQLKEKMMDMVPSLFNEAGVRTMGGTVATGLVAAGLFLILKKFLIKN